MDIIGLDLHKRERQLCILTGDGELIERGILTSRERFTAALGIAHGCGCPSTEISDRPRSRK